MGRIVYFILEFIQCYIVYILFEFYKIYMLDFSC